MPALHILAAAFMVAVPPSPEPDPSLLTVAEASDFTRTARYEEVITLLDAIAEQSPLVHLAEMGTTVEGRSIPLAIIADPPVRTAAEAKATGRPIVFAFGNIHAGEVCGKEALLMLARELATVEDHPWLDDLVVVLAPIYNADGNERFSPDNRPGQVGPEEMGQRPNAQQLDLNRDYVKLESPEGRAIVRFLTEWDPHITIDTHTTNGSHHRLTLTFDYPLNPSGHPAPIALVRDHLLPDVRESLRERTGYDTFFYGNFDRQQRSWNTYSAQPRFGGPYQGLRGQASILSEAHSYAPYKHRVLCTLEFVREIMQYTADHADTIVSAHVEARLDTILAGRHPQPDDVIGIRHRAAAFSRPVVIPGYRMISEPRRRPRPTDEPQDYTVVHNGRFEATRSVARPLAYLIPPGHDMIVEKLQQHGIETESFSGAATVEVYTVTSLSRATRPFQGHHNVLLECDASVDRRAFESGTTMVRTAQPLGTLAVYLLEPECEDGLTTWNFFDQWIEVGGEFPVVRVRAAVDLLSDASP